MFEFATIKAELSIILLLFFVAGLIERNRDYYFKSISDFCFHPPIKLRPALGMGRVEKRKCCQVCKKIIANKYAAINESPCSTFIRHQRVIK
jgi:hypothetical protein